uniref:Protein kinase domain-containing protein n=1 Tax=Oryza brachyantha TaxID=4533 RepID=J3LBW9_ORYBR
MENHEFFFIFENMEFNLYDVVRERQTAFLEEDIRNFMVQILQGLVYMHNNGYSTSNLMALLKLLILGWQEKFLPVLVILAMFPPDADFVFKNSLFLTGEYVSSNLTGLLSNEDMWAVGAIFAELFTLSTLFPGQRFPLAALADKLHIFVTTIQYNYTYLFFFCTNMNDWTRRIGNDRHLLPPAQEEVCASIRCGLG